jgi:hypothetical protein
LTRVLSAFIAVEEVRCILIIDAVQSPSRFNASGVLVGNAGLTIPFTYINPAILLISTGNPLIAFLLIEGGRAIFAIRTVLIEVRDAAFNTTLSLAE